MHSPDERTYLLALARAAVQARAERDAGRLQRLKSHGAETLGTEAPLALKDAPYPSGMFVTLHRHHQLRGCIGLLGGDRPIEAAVVSSAASSAGDDPRFAPVTPDEVPTITIEISVLTPLERVERPEDIEVGRHGLVVERGLQRGLLLPQVATEWGWDRETFLAHTCTKAGLSPDAWRQGATIWRFEAEVFGEP